MAVGEQEGKRGGREDRPVAGGKSAPGRRASPSAKVGITIAAIVAFLVLARLFIIDIAIVDGRSMLPGLGSGDIVLVFKAAYGLRNPAGGYLLLWGSPRHRDIVAAVRPDTGSLVVKRVWIEGEPPPPGAESVFLLLGDNKYESVDSRAFGPVPMSNILGKAFPFPLL
jgi:signal peptidase I